MSAPSIENALSVAILSIGDVDGEWLESVDNMAREGKPILVVPPGVKVRMEPGAIKVEGDRPFCPHGNDPCECDACFAESDFAYDADRER